MAAPQSNLGCDLGVDFPEYTTEWGYGKLAVESEGDHEADHAWPLLACLLVRIAGVQRQAIGQQRPGGGLLPSLDGSSHRRVVQEHLILFLTLRCFGGTGQILGLHEYLSRNAEALAKATDHSQCEGAPSAQDLRDADTVADMGLQVLAG